MARNKEIDIMRGLCIILMVIGHSGFLYKDYIYLFHMAVFFMVSGYLFNDKYSTSASNLILFLKRRLKSLWFPCFAWQMVFVICNNAFVKMNIYTVNPEFVNLTPSVHKELATIMSAKEIVFEILKSFFFLGETQLGGIFWFFQTLFGVSILYCLVEFILRKLLQKDFAIIASHITISVFLLVVGYLNAFPINLLNRICSCYILYEMGKLIHSRSELVKKIQLKSWCMCAIIAFVVLIVFDRYGHISLNINYYENPVFLVCASLSGWVLIYSVSLLLIKSVYIGNIVQMLGQHTVIIAALHFLTFKIINVLQVFIYDKPSFLIASYPIMYSDHGWWVAYTVTGLAVPCVIGMGYGKIKERCINYGK